jgi:hypothetical protein
MGDFKFFTGIILDICCLICMASIICVAYSIELAYAQNASQGFVEWYNKTQKQQLIDPLAIKISSPNPGDIFFMGSGGSNNSLHINGTSSDNSTAPCVVEIIINAVRPYQLANPAGPNGPNDYSVWNLTVAADPFKEGPDNEIAARLGCGPGTIKSSYRSYTVNVTGVRTPEANALSSIENTTSCIPHPNFVTSNISNSPSNNLCVSLAIDKNPIVLGDTASMEINVYDNNTGQKVDYAEADIRVVNASGSILEPYPLPLRMQYGDITHDLRLAEVTSPGNYTAILNTNASGYQPSSNVITFQIGQDQLEDN